MAKTKKRLSRAERERKKELRQQRRMSIVLVIIMLGGLIGVGAYNMSGNQKEEIGSFEYTVSSYESFYDPTTTTEVISLETDRGDVHFYSYPSSVSRLESSVAIKEMLNGSESVIITGAGEEEIESRLLDSLRLHVSTSSPIPILGATTDDAAQGTRPFVTCANATVSQPVITVSFSNQTEITGSGHCINASIKPEQTHLLRDKILYNLYGVSA